MATDWKLASPEQIAERNRKRREAYSKLASEDHTKILRERAAYRKTLTQEQLEQQRKSRLNRSEKSTPYSTYTIESPDGQVSQITNLEMCRHLERAEQRLNRKRTQWEAKKQVIQDWRDAGGMFPWPSLIEKAKTTELWLQIALTLGRACTNCGTSDCFDFSWRLTRRDDYLAFVPFVRKEYERVLREPTSYCLLCVNCAFDVRISCFSRVFTGGSTGSKLLDTMYDPATISERIDRREIRSFTNSFRYSDGRTRHTFIRKNQYYGWVGLQPRDLCGYTVVQGREIYLQANPSSNAQYWGMGYTDSDNYLTVEQSGWDALSETTKRFIQEEAIKCQPLQNQISLTVSNKALGNMQ